MTVVIHEFEVIPEPAPGEQKGLEKPPQQAEATTATLTPQEVERVVHRQIMRLMRVRTY